MWQGLTGKDVAGKTIVITGLGYAGIPYFVVVLSPLKRLKETVKILIKWLITLIHYPNL